MRHLFNFENKSDRLASRELFSRRLVNNGLAALIIIIVAIAIGMTGYMALGHMGAVDAFESSAMILSGMGPVGDLDNTPAKIFAGVYAIFCGLLIFAIAGIVLAPVFHRILHRLHVEDSDR